MNESPDHQGLAERLSAVEAVLGAMARKLQQPELRVLHDAVRALPAPAAAAAHRWMPPEPQDPW